MAEIEFARFGKAVADRLREAGLSYSDAVARWPQLDRSMLSRAVNGKPLSAGNYLIVCKMLQLEPYAFLKEGRKRRVTIKQIRKTLEHQPVAVGVPRETRGVAR